MSATDTIRAMLDERGVPFKTYVVKLYDVSMEVGTVYSSNGIDWLAIENPDTHRISVTNFKNELTPEQAIEATLGRGECRNAAPSYLDFLCSECGFVHYHSDTNDTGDGNEWNYCPNCGKRVRA